MGRDAPPRPGWSAPRARPGDHRAAALVKLRLMCVVCFIWQEKHKILLFVVVVFLRVCCSGSCKAVRSLLFSYWKMVTKICLGFTRNMFVYAVERKMFAGESALVPLRTRAPDGPPLHAPFASHDKNNNTEIHVYIDVYVCVYIYIYIHIL